MSLPYRGLGMCFMAACFYCYEYLLRIIPGAMSSELRAAMPHLSASQFGLVVAFYYFAYTPMQLPVGLLMDKFGVRRLLIAACAFCALGAWFFSFFSLLTVVAIGRFLIGFGSAFAFVGVLKLADMWLPRRYLARVAGFLTALGMLGAITGELGIDYVINHYGWQSVLHYSVIIGVVLTGLIFIAIYDAPTRVASQNHSINYFISELVKVLLTGKIWLVGVIGAILYLSLSVFAEVWGKAYLIEAHHLSSHQAGVAISFVFIGWAIGAPIAGWLSGSLFKIRTLLISGTILASITISLVLYLSNLGYFTLITVLFLYGLFCSTEILVFIAAKYCVNESSSGMAFASVNMVVMIGGVLFQPLVGQFLDWLWQGEMVNAMRVYDAFAFKWALCFLPISLLIAAGLCFKLPKSI